MNTKPPTLAEQARQKKIFLKNFFSHRIADESSNIYINDDLLYLCQRINNASDLDIARFFICLFPSVQSEEAQKAGATYRHEAKILLRKLDLEKFWPLLEQEYLDVIWSRTYHETTPLFPFGWSQYLFYDIAPQNTQKIIIPVFNSA